MGNKNKKSLGSRFLRTKSLSATIVVVILLTSLFIYTKVKFGRVPNAEFAKLKNLNILRKAFFKNLK